MVVGSSEVREDGLPGQVEGYWFAEDEDVPAERPPYLPTGAVLPPKGAQIAEHVLCLDLVNVAGEWRPLSEAGRYTYSHTAGLLRGEPWSFVTWIGGRRFVYEADLGESLEPAEVAEVFGGEAAMRARPDRPAVRLQLRPA